jgi:hypothetical protein
MNRRKLSSYFTGGMYGFTLIFGVSDIAYEYFLSDELSEIFLYKIYGYSLIITILVCLDTLIYEIIGMSDNLWGAGEDFSEDETKDFEKEERASFDVEAMRRFKAGEISEAALIEFIKDESKRS